MWRRYGNSALLTHSFLHLTGVGRATEESWWDQGIDDWDDLAQSGHADAQQLADLKESAVRLNQRDSAWFERRLPAAERWRLYADFLDDAAFLDIETTGLSSEYSYTTMVGVLDNSGYHAFVRGDNLDEFLCSLRRYKLVVTFNGASFDLPFLRGEFGKLPDGFAHMDLRWVLARLGYRGGLKKIERSTGLDRQGGLADLDGRHAVLLWEMAQQGEDEALETLIRYNAEDVASLPLLAEMALLEHSAGTPMGVEPVPRFPRFDCSALPYDRSLIKYMTG